MMQSVDVSVPSALPPGGVKFFLGGLTPQMTEDKLTEYFQKIGEISDVKVMMNGATGHSRGFGFIAFADAGAAYNGGVLSNRHEIDGRVIDVKQALPRGVTATSDKIAVVGLGSDLGHDRVFAHFALFGAVASTSMNSSVDYSEEQFASQPECTWTVTFRNPDAAAAAMYCPLQHEIEGYVATVQAAEPDAMSVGQMHPQAAAARAAPAPYPGWQSSQASYRHVLPLPVTAYPPGGKGGKGHAMRQYGKGTRMPAPRGMPVTPDRDPRTAASASAVASAPAELKVFVGGLAQATTEPDLEQHFGQFGAVHICEVKRDNHGTSRGFGFIVFNDPGAAAAALSVKYQQIAHMQPPNYGAKNARGVEVKACVARTPEPPVRGGSPVTAGAGYPMPYAAATYSPY